MQRIIYFDKKYGKKPSKNGFIELTNRTGDLSKLKYHQEIKDD